MGISVFTDSSAATMNVPISLLFWLFVAAYVIHILEESLLGEVFVDKVKRLYWPQYSWTRFAWFNTLLILLEVLSIALFETSGGAWIVFPLSLFAERFYNGFYHLIETLATRRFSSGLLSSLMFWILGYFIIRYAIVPGAIAFGYWLASALVGLALAAGMLGIVTLGVMRKFSERNGIA